MNEAAGSCLLRGLTRDHYDRYPFGFDEAQILEEKYERRVMGEAIQELALPGTLVVDVGCGACRVAQIVSASSDARTLSLDLSLNSLRAARSKSPGTLVNGDNLQLPLGSDCGDLVISNGVIHHTPDPHASFRELVRITKPGGTLVVSVYDRSGWYYYVYHYPGAVIRALHRLTGEIGIAVVVFPFFYLASVILLSVSARRFFPLRIATAWNLLHDQFTTPVCEFHTFNELQRWADEAGLVVEERRSEAARQLATLRLKKPKR